MVLLAGVMLGAAGTLLRQYMTQRGGMGRDEVQQARGRRAERKDATVGILSATERTEQYRGPPTRAQFRVNEGLLVRIQLRPRTGAARALGIIIRLRQ